MRTIDKTKPLSDEDKLYLQSREGLPGGGLPEGETRVPFPTSPHEDEEYTGSATNNAPTGASGPTPAANQSPSGDGDYDKMKVDDLIEEVNRRNGDRSEDDAIVPESSRKADLIDALEADDLAAAEVG